MPFCYSLLISQRCLHNCISDIFQTLCSTNGQYSLNFINISSVFYHFSIISLWCHGWRTLKLDGWHPEVLDLFIVTLSSPRRPAIGTMLETIWLSTYRSVWILLQSTSIDINHCYFLFGDGVLSFFRGHFVERCWNLFEDSYKICMLMWVWHHGGVHPNHPKSSWTGVRKVHPGHSQGQWVLVDILRSHEYN